MTPLTSISQNHFTRCLKYHCVEKPAAHRYIIYLLHIVPLMLESDLELYEQRMKILPRS